MTTDVLAPRTDDFSEAKAPQIPVLPGLVALGGFVGSILPAEAARRGWSNVADLACRIPATAGLSANSEPASPAIGAGTARNRATDDMIEILRGL